MLLQQPYRSPLPIKLPVQFYPLPGSAGPQERVGLGGEDGATPFSAAPGGEQRHREGGSASPPLPPGANDRDSCVRRGKRG